MPGGFLNHHTSTQGIESHVQGRELLWDDTLLYPARWSYQRRSPRSLMDRNSWRSRWPSSSFMSGSASSPMTIFGDDSAFGGGLLRGAFEYPICIGEGTQSTKFIKGTCRNSTNQVVAGAVVHAFRTADDVEVGQATSFEDGTYIVGTDNPVSTTHYIVAYKVDSPDIAGTTVNTLVPTNIDGT